MTLSDRLADLMEERRINRAELAKGAGIPYTTIVALFEKGADNTKLSTMRKLAKYFEITLDDLADGTSNSRSSDEIQTIAAHHDGEEWTEEEIEEIEQFKKFVKMKRLQG